jgi:hypothetical protein
MPLELVLANTAHITNVPGRVKDACWVSDLLAHGLTRPSFVPNSPTQGMRMASLKTYKHLVRKTSSHGLWMQKTLEPSNITLGRVILDAAITPRPPTPVSAECWPGRLRKAGRLADPCASLWPFALRNASVHRTMDADRTRR